MERILNSRYRITFLNHERPESKFTIPPNEGFYVPIVLWHFLERQYGASHGLDETIRQMQFTEKKRKEKRNQHSDWDDVESVSSFGTSASQPSTSGHEDDEEIQKRSQIDVTIQLYFDPGEFLAFCVWVQRGYSCSIDAQVFYPVIMKWCGIPLEDHFYSNYEEPLFEVYNTGQTKIQRFLGLIESNISHLNALRPSPSGSIGYRCGGGHSGRGWGWALTGQNVFGQQNTSYKLLPLVLFYEKKFIQAVKSFMKNNKDFSGELTVPSSSHLTAIPLLNMNDCNSTRLRDFHPQQHSDDKLLKSFKSPDGFFSISKALVELDSALGQLDILLDAIGPGPAEIPKFVQLFMDNIVLSKQIPIQEAQRRCFEEFDIDDEFWEDIEQHVGKMQWEELKRFHYQHVEKRQKLNVKRPLENFLDAFSEVFDEDWKLKMFVRLKWAKKVAQLY